jgi:hypothetical protein
MKLIAFALLLAAIALGARGTVDKLTKALQDKFL